MDDYINREDAFNIKNYLKRFSCFGDNGFVEIEGVLIALSKIPSADVAPVRHGRWIEDKIQIHIEKTYHCSECECQAWGEYEKTNYCPNCGAKMFAKDINVPNKKGEDNEID